LQEKKKRRKNPPAGAENLGFVSKVEEREKGPISKKKKRNAYVEKGSAP